LHTSRPERTFVLTVKKEPRVKGTILDFLKLASEKPELASELVKLARRYDFEFNDEVSDADLERVWGGVGAKVVMQSLTGGGLPDGLSGPPGSSGVGVPIPYPNVSGDSSSGAANATGSGDGGDLPPSQGDLGIGTA
jgi:hypothetical protein